MATETKREESDLSTPRDDQGQPNLGPKPNGKAKPRSIDKGSPGGNAAKRRCVSTACIACRKRKSKCDGNTPSCAACSSVYGTECIYDPNSDHRRKGVYKKDIDNLKTRNSTLQTLIQAILNFPENEIPELVKQIRTCESLDDVAESIIARDNALVTDDDDTHEATTDFGASNGVPRFEKELSGKMGKLRLDNGSVSIIGGTSNLIYVDDNSETDDWSSPVNEEPFAMLQQDPIISWTDVTNDSQLVMHLMTMYFTWHYTYFTTLSRELFWNEFKLGRIARDTKWKTEYCTPLLVNAMLALGCHFTSWPAARADPEDSATAGDHFFNEAKRLILENDEHEKPRLATVQALALMSVREAGCGREARGWVYSGMSFRMAYDLGLNIDSSSHVDDSEVDAQRITMWGCFLFDKCWSNYLGRQPQITLSTIAIPKFNVFPVEESETWRPYLDTGHGKLHSQPARTRAIALQISQLCEISSDLLHCFYHPQQLEKPLGRQAELKKLGELHTRLEAWRKNLPKEMEAREGQLPNVLVMHMFFQLLFIHLFRPFLKYKQASSPLPSHVSPRKFITHSAAAISKLLRLYRRTYGLRQICNIVVYIVHTACTVHLLNLPDKSAQRDIQHGLNHLEEIAEGWLGARRTLSILHVVAERWNAELPEACIKTFIRVKGKFGSIRPTPEQELEPKVEDSYQPNMHTIPHQNNSAQSHHVHPPLQHHHDLFPSSGQIHPSPMSTPDLPNHLPDNLALPQSPAGLTHLSRPQEFVYPQTHPQTHSSAPNPQQGYPTHRAPPSTTQAQGGLTSPTQLFGGVQKLIQDQDWWLRDSNQLFANWNADPGATQQQEEAYVNGSGNGGYTGRGGGAKRGRGEDEGFEGWELYDFGSGTGGGGGGGGGMDGNGQGMGGFGATMNRYGEMDGI